jgi:hypothetical protein
MQSEREEAHEKLDRDMGSYVMATKIMPIIDVVIKSQTHPWHNERGATVAFEPYGPSMFGWSGWRVRLENGTECYAKAHELLVIP